MMKYRETRECFSTVDSQTSILESAKVHVKMQIL